MSLGRITFEQVLVVLVIIAIGIICYKIKLIDEETNKRLNDILLKLVMPTVILVSYQRELSRELLNGLLVSIVLALITHIFSILVANFFFRKNKRIISVEKKSLKTTTITNTDSQTEHYTPTY